MKSARLKKKSMPSSPQHPLKNIPFILNFPQSSLSLQSECCLCSYFFTSQSISSQFSLLEVGLIKFQPENFLTQTFKYIYILWTCKCFFNQAEQLYISNIITIIYIKVISRDCCTSEAVLSNVR